MNHYCFIFLSTSLASLCKCRNDACTLICDDSMVIASNRECSRY